MAKARKGTDTNLPTRDEILEFLRDTDQAAGKREIARAFHLKGPERAALKRLLREMADEGLIAKESKKSLRPAGELPPVTVVEIIGQDPDGELLCRPTRWEEEVPPPQILLAPAEGPAHARQGAAVGIGDRILARLERDPEGGYLARIMRRVGDSEKQILGVFRINTKGAREGRVEPVDRRARHDFVVALADSAKAQDGDLVMAEVLSVRAHGPKRARVRDRLGNVDEPKAISLIAIHAHGIPVEFPEKVSSEAARLRPPKPAARTDLRDMPLITIDPEDARDFDDAIHAERDPDPTNEGGFRVTVAIADVAHYVRPGNPLDKEAIRRGNSVYFPDRVVPMLPERLSNDLCSLKPGVNRSCLAVRMTFAANGQKRRHEFIRGLMRSAARLTYEEAQAAFDGKPGRKATPLMDPVLAPLFEAYKAVAAARDRRQPLDLDLPERRIELADTGEVKRIYVKERLDAHRLVEEFMIQANVAAAETLERRRTPLLYRIHDAPDPEKLVQLTDYLATIGLKLAKGQVVKPAHFNRLLSAARARGEIHVVSEVILRAQSQAVYAPDNLGHFGLNLRRYAHFTSPIRRYADLIVHRALIRALELGADGLADAEMTGLGELGELISGHERRAMAAERDSVDRYLAAFLEDRIGGEFEGRVAGVTRFGLFVKLNETGADGLVPIATLGNEYFFHDESRHALIGERTGAAFRLGDPVLVRLEEAAPVSGGLRFELLSDAPTTMKPGKGRNARPSAKGRRKTGKGGPRGRGRRR